MSKQPACQALTGFLEHLSFKRLGKILEDFYEHMCYNKGNTNQKRGGKYEKEAGCDDLSGYAACGKTAEQ